MADADKTIRLASRLLLSCATVRPNQANLAAIQQCPFEELDWTLFTRLAIDSGLAGLVGQTLNRVVPDRVPEEMLRGLRTYRDETRQRSRSLLAELERVIDALGHTGIEALPLRGPILAMQAFGDLGLRAVGTLDLLVRRQDIASALTGLHRLGYGRRGQLSAAQLDLIALLQGRETLFDKASGIALTVHTRLMPFAVPLAIDYGALWDRAQRTDVSERMLRVLSPEDQLLTLAIHAGGEPWGSVGWAGDIAAFIDSHPQLDWVRIRERARAGRCLRILLLAMALTRRYFGGTAPEAIAAAQLADRRIEPIAQRVMSQRLAADAGAIPHGTDRAIKWFRLQDGLAGSVRYLMRIVLLPAPHHVARIRLPRALTSWVTYIPLKLGQELVLLPLLRVCRELRLQSQRLRGELRSSRLVLALLPLSAETRRKLMQHLAARLEAMRALAVNPNDAGMWHRLGSALAGLGRFDEALACYDKALAIAPDNGRFWKDRSVAANASRARGTADFEDERSLDPHDAGAWARRAGFLAASQRHAEAAAASDRALAIDPGHFAARRIGIKSRIAACDWRRREQDKRSITEGLQAGLPIITPFNHRAISESDAEHLVVARLFARNFPQSKPLWQGERYHHERIRVAYLSGNLHKHPVAMQVVGVLEHHDKMRFQTIAFSSGPDDGSALRRRIEAAMDHFIDAQAMNDVEVAAKLRAMEVDILVDLNGYTGTGRTAVLAHRPSPVQINYFVNVGTMGAALADYIIADETVIPRDHFADYAEKIVYLPNSYQCNDSRRFFPQRSPSRAAAGLPEAGFVFCCFNNHYKIGPAMFEVWMRVLNAVPGSVLWLMGGNPDGMQNLRREAAARGVAPERLVFAPRLPEPDHLARLGLGGLFLDTLPVNANATASDALWAGLPVLTCMGETFAGRVAASMLRAIGLPDLVTSSLAEYEELALRLAHDGERLAALKSRLARNREREPLFDTPRYTRDLESAFTIMCEYSRRGEPPKSFSVPSAVRPREPLDA